MRKIIPGYRFFQCEECDFIWKEKCRDHQSCSQSGCPQCCDLTEPYQSIAHSEWPVDGFGNLIENDN